MKPIIVNQESENKDCADLICYNVFLDGVKIWPVSRAGQEVPDA